MPIKKITSSLLTLSLLSLLLVACQGNQPKETNKKVLVTSCTDVGKLGMTSLSINDQQQICQIMTTDLGRNPPVYLLRDFVRLVFLMKETASNDDVDVLAKNAMQVINARQQQNNDAAIENTLDTIWKVYQATQTKVTFNDLAKALQAQGKNAKNVSDNQLEVLGINLYQEKIRSIQK